MKTRQGFVSNSSSTSFCLYGIYREVTDEQEDKVSKAKNMDTYCNWESSETNKYVGVSLTTMKDEETFAQFKERVTKQLQEIFGEDVKPSVMEDSWYNG